MIQSMVGVIKSTEPSNSAVRALGNRQEGIPRISITEECTLIL